MKRKIMGQLKALKKNLPLQLIVAIGLAVLSEPFFSSHVLSLFYTLSCIFKDVLMMAVPFVVFGYLMSSIVSFDKKSLGMIFIIFTLATLSNFVSVWMGYAASFLFFPYLSFDAVEPVQAGGASLEILWALPWKSPITPPLAMMVAFLLGFAAIFCHLPALKKMAFQVRDGSTKVLRKVFIPFLPVYVFGFILQLQHSGSFGVLLRSYGKVFLLIVLVVGLYMLGWYVLAARVQKIKLMELIKPMFPAVLTGFTTMSSAATLPVTLEGVEKILKRRDYADFVVPLTANIHTIGDILNISISALALLWITGLPLPTWEMYGLFSLYFCLTKFSSAGVPGGGIIVMLPIIQHYLGFGSELSSLLTTLYILQDPFITAMNVAGNGAFATLTAPLFSRKKKHP